MSVLFLLLLFFAVTLFFGSAFSAAVLGERRVFAVWPFGVLIGINAYLFLVNLISYAVPLGLGVWLVLALLAAAAIPLWRAAFGSGRAVFAPSGLQARELVLLFGVAVLISAVSGIIALRTLQYDDLSLGHLPLAATMVEGNFPIMDPSAPDRPMAYHYVSEIFTVALHQIAGTPLWLGYDIQTFLMSGTLFLMAFLLAFHLRRNFWSSLAAAFLLFYGGGLTWLYFTEGLSPLWQTYVLGQAVPAPWKFVASMTIPQLWSGFVFIMNNHAIEIGLAVTVFVLYCCLRAFKDDPRWLRFALVGGVSFGYLALSAETNFAVLGAAFLLVLAVEILFRLRHRSKPDGVFFWGRHALAVLPIVLGLGAVLAAFQGGILSSFSSGGLARSLSLTWRFWVVDFAERTGPFLIGSWLFWVELGLSPLVALTALYFFRRERPILFLALPAVLAFGAPFFLRYAGGGEPRRLFGSLALPVLSFLVGLFLVEVWPQLRERLGRSASLRVVLSLLFLVASSSLLFQLVYLVTPLGSVGKFNRPFIERPSPPRPIDERAYQWIRAHTTLQDRFFPYGLNGTNFIRETGRFIPSEINLTTLEVHAEQYAAYRAIFGSCDRSGFAMLKARYVYLSPDVSVKDFESQCLRNIGAELVYADRDNADFRRIYRLPSSTP